MNSLVWNSQIFSNAKTFLERNIEKSIMIFSLILGIASTIYYYSHGLILAYGDAESHINIAKRVVSGITPGFGQLGGNWLPLPHILMMPFVLSDFLWRTGLGGSIVSVLCAVASSAFAYKIVKLMSFQTSAAVLAALIVICNPAILYLEVTPMGELPLIMTLFASVYFFIRWSIFDSILDLIISSFFILCGTLIRYDAWFVFLFSIVGIIIIGILKRFSYKKIEGITLLFTTLSMMGIVLWIGWNILIFKNPLYFLNSPYSTKSQQLSWLKRGELPSYKSIKNSIIFYTVDTTDNIGKIAAVLFILGIAVSVCMYFSKKHRKTKYAFLSSFLLLTPYPFYAITLYLGISIILIPGLVPKSFSSQLFNVRYGTMMIPGASVFIALLFASVNRFGKAIVLILILWQFYLLFKSGTTIVLSDALYGLSSRHPSPANLYIAKYYDYGFVMFDDFSRVANPVDLGIPMNKIIYVGNHPYWDVSLTQPIKYIRWFIFRKDENDVVWNELKNNFEFKKYYYGVYNNGRIFVYKLKPQYQFLQKRV